MQSETPQPLRPKPASISGAPAVPTPKKGRFAKLKAWFASPTAPYAMGAIILVVAAGIAYEIKYGFKNPFAGGQLTGGAKVVLFDPVKFMNAQRAATSILLSAPNADLALTMTQVASKAESVIREEAGDAIILVKQAVVIPTGMPDITDRVLKRFGLPTSVPTITTMKLDSLANVAPTDAAFTEFAQTEELRINQIETDKAYEAKAQIKAQQDSILP